VEDLPYRIEQLLGSRKLAEMGRAAKALGRPQAARDIVNEVVRRASWSGQPRTDTEEHE
jgi:UDP-N-acetylglucosamine:LPS N-acetylglucosamine transferase